MAWEILQINFFLIHAGWKKICFAFLFFLLKLTSIGIYWPRRLSDFEKKVYGVRRKFQALIFF